MEKVVVNKHDQDQRLDKYLLKYLNSSTKTFIYKMLRKKNIVLNDKRAQGNEIINSGDVITLYLSPETICKFKKQHTIHIPKNSLNLEIVFEDENILIINKKAGVLSHSQFRDDHDTLIDMLKYYLNQNKSQDEFDNNIAICNRLDRNTSGIIFCGKNYISIKKLNEMFNKNYISKYYVALVSGKLEQNIVLKDFILKNNANKIAKIANYDQKDAKQIVTEIFIIQNVGEFSLLEIKIQTGKFHQIRAHLAHIGYPIIGDFKYGNTNINQKFKINYNLNRQFLHSHKVIINDIDGHLEYLKSKQFDTEIPYELENVLNKLGFEKII